MADTKLSDMTDVGALADSDLLYLVRAGAWYKTTVGAVKTALAGIQGTVATHADLPVTLGTPALGAMYYVTTASGTWILGTKKERGFWRRTANGGTLADWTHQNDTVELTIDSTGVLVDDGDNTKKLQWQLSGISTGQTRVLVPLDKSYTVEETGHASKHLSGGADAIKLDDLAAPDDNTDRDATSSLHGLMPKADKAKLDKIYAAKADVASAGTIDLDAAASDLIEITGTTTITAITLAAGMHRIVRFQGALTLTHGSSLVLPGAANITTAAGDFAIFRGYAAGVVRCVAYTKASGVTVVAAGGTGNSSATAYAVLCGGTTSTGALQSIASVGTSGQVLTSNGAGALPTFQAAAAGSALTWPDIEAAQGMGSTYAACNFPTYAMSTNAAMNDGQVIFIAVYLPTAQTITGAVAYQSVQGNYTGDNNNKVGLYTYSGGTLTLVASSTNDSELWKATANTFVSKDFSSPYSASAGLLVIAFLWNNSASTTAPSLGRAATTINLAAMAPGTTNSGKLIGTLTGQTDLPSSQAMSGITGTASVIWGGIY